MGFLNILREAQIHTISKKMGKSNFHSMVKLWENTNISRVWASYIFHLKQKSIQFPNDVINEFLHYRISMRKHKNQELLTYFSWSRNPYNFRNVRKLNFHSTGKLWENTNVSKVWVSYIFYVKQKSILYWKHGKMNFHSKRKA